MKRVHYIDNYLIDPQHPVTVNLIGAGGTGSQVLTCLARLDVTLRALGHPGLSVTLYHYLPSTSTDFGQKCCAYSNPRFGRMYKLNATANGNIECDTLYVTLYDSLEIMGCELREELLKVIKNGHMLFARSEEELLRDFI